MITYLMSLGVDVWHAVLDGYEKPTILIRKYAKHYFLYNTKAMNAILSGIYESRFVKFMHCMTKKDICGNFINNYEGNSKVNKEKLQVYRIKFESIKMNEKVDIKKEFLHVDEIVNTIRGIEEIVDNFDFKKC